MVAKQGRRESAPIISIYRENEGREKKKSLYTANSKQTVLETTGIKHEDKAL
jgi:hypothetical protein